MSSYYDIGINPKTGLEEKAMWVDDAYGQHMYGVQFSDGEMYPVTEITRVSSIELFERLCGEIERLRKGIVWAGAGLDHGMSKATIAEGLRELLKTAGSPEK